MENKLKNIYTVLNNEYPFSNAEEWDNVGLVFGSKNKPINNLLVALDLTTEVFDKAIEYNVDAIITHHPFLFGEDQETDLNANTYKKSLLERVENTGIGIIHIHTNFDKPKHGMSLYVANQLGLKGKQIKNSYGFQVVEEKKVSDIYKMFEKNGTPILRDNGINKNKVINKFSVIPGAGSIQDINNHFEEGSELIITSDIKWSTWVTAKESRILLGAVSHGIEKAFIGAITKLMKKTFKDVGVINIFPKELF